MVLLLNVFTKYVVPHKTTQICKCFPIFLQYRLMCCKMYKKVTIKKNIMLILTQDFLTTKKIPCRSFYYFIATALKAMIMTVKGLCQGHR